MLSEDVIADVQTYFQQIIELIDLLEIADHKNRINFITLRDLAQSGLEVSMQLNQI